MSPWLQPLKLPMCRLVLHLKAFTGSSLPSTVEISSWTKSQKNAEKMAKVCMAGEPGRDPAFAVHFFIFLEESLYPLQLLLLQQEASKCGKTPEVQSLHWVFFLQVQLVIRNLLVLLPEVLWDCAGWEKPLPRSLEWLYRGRS